MRIGIDCRLWNESGVGRYTRNLVRELSVLDTKNEYCLFGLTKDIESIKDKGLRIKDNNWKTVETNIRWHSLEEQIKFPQILNRENLDLMHFPYFSVPVFYNKPFVITIHDLILDHFPTGQASTLSSPLYYAKLLGYRFVIKNAARKAKRIITVSEATKKEIVEHLKVASENIEVTHEGVDSKISNIKYQISNKYQFKNDEISKITGDYFLYVGNAYPHKNLDLLISAFSKIKTENIKLILVGKEDFFYKRLREKVKKAGLEDNINFFGEASDEELQYLYQNAKTLILPSLMEGFGLPLLEAMANKCLILCSNIAVFHEIGGDAPLYFDPKNEDDLAGKMKEVLCRGDGYSNDRLKKGIERAKNYSWEKMAKETLDIYSRIVSN